ncbi:MAG: hypothetical protein HKN27_14105 [Silicimonas sp.]|nr:hypothetical protein [Silicimonas sp.]
MMRVFLSVTAFALAVPAQATVIDGSILQQNGSGAFVILDPEDILAVGEDNFNDDNLYAFDEDQNIELIEPVRVDIGGQNGVIPAGTVVASHYVFFDSVAGTQFGFVYFDAPILGIAALEGTMAATDFLANTDVIYIGTELRGLEHGDTVWIDDKDPHRLFVSWAGSSPGDYIRVFTEKSPGALIM